MAKQPHDKTYSICGAKTRKGTPCLRPAGWGTKHQGKGKCKLHGGKSTGPPKKNKNAESHGFFSKYLPDDTLNIIQDIKIKKSIDILWENIQIQYAAIIRSQKIMHVENIHDITKELKKEKTVTGDMSSMHEEEYEIQFAWDKQATFLKAQSRAMSELRTMIIKYDELCKTELVTEEQKLRIKKLKVDIEKVEGNEEELNKLDKLIEGINNAAKQ